MSWNTSTATVAAVKKIRPTHITMPRCSLSTAMIDRQHQCGHQADLDPGEGVAGDDKKRDPRRERDQQFQK